MESSLHEKENASLKQLEAELNATRRLVKDLESKISNLENARVIEVETMGRVLISKTIEAGELEAENIKLQQVNSDLKDMKEANQQLSAWIRQLHKEHRMLLNTRRWKIGNKIINLLNMLRFKQEYPRSIARMNNIFTNFELWKKQKNISKSEDTYSYHTAADIKQLTQLMKQLEKEMNGLFKTKRWKVGSFLGNISSVFRGHEKTPKSTIKIQNIITDFRSWSPYPGNESSDTIQLSNQIEELRLNFQALLTSRRWKMGDKVVSMINKLIMRNKPPKAVERINNLFSKYDRWKGLNI